MLTCNELTLNNKHQHTTRYIKHLADSANFKGVTFNKHRNGLIGNRFEMPNVSYTAIRYPHLPELNRYPQTYRLFSYINTPAPITKAGVLRSIPYSGV